MSRLVRLSALILALTIAIGPGLAFARAGDSSSMGSRGTRTYSAPAPTNTSPYGSAPMQRSLTPNAPSPSYGSTAPGYAPRPMFGGGFGSGLLGGLVGAGIGGMLFGHGFWGGGGMGFGGLFGMLIQFAILYFVGRWLFRTFMGGGSGQPMFAGLGNMARGMGGAPGIGPGLGPMSPGAPASPPLPITPADYQQFEQSLKDVQAAWSAQDINRLRMLATPEMVSYFAEQLAQHVSRGVRNTVTAVNLDRGDLSEAWREAGRDYATVAMSFSMLDATYDQAGRLVDGSATERTSAVELWTFLRSPGGRWVLSAIQQAR